MQDPQRFAYLHAMGIDVWRERAQPCAAEKPVDRDATWAQLQRCVTDCVACPLHKSRTQTVFGVGDRRAKLMIVGEAPGAHEDQQGVPFVGRAGQLLDAILASVGFRREDVYIANILKCRPPNNRDPSPEEVAQCTPFLERQMALIQPALLVAVGRIAAHYLLKTNTALGQLRNQTHVFGVQQIPLRVTYHPAYLLRSPREKRKAWQDFLTIKQLLADKS